MLGQKQEAPPAWLPTDLTSLLAWYDADDADTITHSSGAVSQWNDKSGNAYHAVQATGSLQPTTNSRTENSKNVVDFPDGKYLQKTSFPMPATGHVFVVCHPDVRTNAADAVLTYTTLFQMDAGGTASKWRARVWNDGTHHSTCSGAGSGDAGFLGTTFIWDFSFDDTANQVINRVDGTILNTVNNYTTDTRVAYTTNGILRIGANSGAAHFLDGAVAEIVVCNAVLTGTDRTNLMNYLADKWGVTL